MKVEPVCRTERTTNAGQIPSPAYALQDFDRDGGDQYCTPFLHKFAESRRRRVRPKEVDPDARVNDNARSVAHDAAAISAVATFAASALATISANSSGV